jgi:hypothetical protein
MAKKRKWTINIVIELECDIIDVSKMQEQIRDIEKKIKNKEKISGINSGYAKGIKFEIIKDEII